MRHYPGIDPSKVKDAGVRRQLQAIDRFLRDVEAYLSPNQSQSTLEADIDHGSVSGLADDDHTQYLLADGTRALTGDWDAGAFKITADELAITNTAADPTLTLTGNTAAGTIIFDDSDNEFDVSDHVVFADNVGLKLGTGKDAAIYYDSTNLVLNPVAAGSGGVVITGGGNFQLARSNAGAFTIWSGSAQSTLGTHYTFADSAGSDILTIGTSGIGGAVHGLDYTGALHIGLNSSDVRLGKAGSPTTIFGTTQMNENVTIGTGTAVDRSITFNGSAFDGVLTWDESADGFRMDHYFAIGAVPGTSTRRFQVIFSDSTLTNKIGAYAQVTNGLDSGGTVSGLQCYSQSTNTAGASTTYRAGDFLATYSNANGAPTDVLGGKFTGTISNRNAATSGGVYGGKFIAKTSLGAGKGSGALYAMSTEVNKSGAGTDTSAYGLYIQPDLTGTGVITNHYGIRVLHDDTITQTNYSSLYVDALPAGLQAAAKGNVRMVGGDWNTGHMQLDAQHLWQDQTNTILRFKGSAPTVTTDGIGFGEAGETGAQTPTLSANLPAAAAATASVTWIPVWIGATKGWIPVWQ